MTLVALPCLSELRERSIQLRGTISALSRSFTLGPLELEIQSGRTTAILGPSGSGKSTLLRLIAGVARPDHGSVALPPAPAGGPSPAAVVFQDAALYPHLTARENAVLQFQVRAEYRERRSAALPALASSLGLAPHLLDSRPPALSGGERQRVAILKVLISASPVWLMDEPLASLDAQTRYRVRSVIRERQLAEGSTLVLVTHDISDAVAIADTLLIMDGGRILQGGPVNQVLENPNSIEVSRATSDPPVNEIRFVAQLTNHSTVLQGAQGFSLSLPVTVGALDGAQAQRDVLAAIPPSAAVLSPRGGTSDAAALLATVVLLQRHHGDLLAECDTPIGRLRCITTTHAAAVGDQMRVEFNPGRLRFFDPSSGGALTVGEPRTDLHATR